MYKRRHMLGLIPARGGSKRLLQKNVRLLLGKSLIAWTIERALASRCLDNIVVSTDDEKIAKISRKYGVKIINRPKFLAKDASLTIDVAKHALKILREKENYVPDGITLLQPTSPLRRTDDIDNSIEFFYNNGCKNIVSVCETNPYWSLTIKNNYVRPMFGWDFLIKKKSKSFSKTYIINGAIYITTLKNMNKYNCFITKKTMPYVMPRERSMDIDYEIDFKFAEFLLNNKKL